MKTKTMKITHIAQLILFCLSTLLLAGCGGGGSSSGSSFRGSGELITILVRCVTVADTVVTNNCSFNVNVRYFSSEIRVGIPPQETVTELSPGQSIDVAPFDSARSSGIPACQAPLIPSQIFQATMTITCDPAGA